MEVTCVMLSHIAANGLVEAGRVSHGVECRRRLANDGYEVGLVFRLGRLAVP